MPVWDIREDILRKQTILNTLTFIVRAKTKLERFVLCSRRSLRASEWMNDLFEVDGSIFD